MTPSELVSDGGVPAAKEIPALDRDTDVSRVLAAIKGLEVVAAEEDCPTEDDDSRRGADDVLGWAAETVITEPLIIGRSTFAQDEP